MRGVVCSVMHTGTWFTIEAMKRLGCCSVLPWRHSYEVGGGLDVDWLHLHMGCDPVLVPWQEHRFLRNILVDAFVLSGRYPVVVPVRDPILALISHENRRGQGPQPDDAPLSWVVDSFKRLADLYAAGPSHVHWFPVDLPRGVPARMAAVQGLDAFAGGHADESAMYGVAYDWEPLNRTAGDPSGLRQDYTKGDVSAVARALAPELAYLHAHGQIAEMYVDLGYRLPWLQEVAKA